MSRVKKSIYNAKISIIFLVLSTIATFFSRTIFLDYLGPEFIGLTTTLSKIILFVSVTELGIGTAVTSSLYKPLHEKDEEKTQEIICLLGIAYKAIAYGAIVLSFVGFFFLEKMTNNTDISIISAFSIYICLVLSIFIDYRFNYKQIILNADQRYYVITKYLQGTTILRNILQMVFLIYTENVIIWSSLYLVSSLLNSILINKYIKTNYNWLNISKKSFKTLLSENENIVDKVKQVFIHKISGFVSNSSDSILIFMFGSLSQVAAVGNYQIIFGQLTTLYRSLFSGVHAGVGDLIATGNNRKIIENFYQLNALRWMIAVVLSVCLLELTNSFIKLWVGSDFVLDDTTLVIFVMIMTVSVVRGTVDNYINGFGLFSDVKAPIFEIIINITVSLVFGYYIGVNGILLGTFISVFVIIILWKPYYLFKCGMSCSFKYYLMLLIKNIAILLLINYVLSYLFNVIDFSINTYKDWMLSSIIVFLISFISTSFLYIVLDVYYLNVIKKIIKPIYFNFVKYK